MKKHICPLVAVVFFCCYAPQRNLNAGTASNEAAGVAAFTIPAAAANATITVTERVDVSCSGAKDGRITVTLAGFTDPPGQVTWSDGATGTSRLALADGIYVASVANGQGGTISTEEIFISSPTPVKIGILSQSDVTNNGGADGAASLSARCGSPGYTFVWSDGPTVRDRDDLPAGRYSVTASDFNACPTTLADVEIAEPDQVPFPVEFLTFTGHARAKVNLLNWTTATETDNAGFEVQRKQSDLSWRTLGFVTSRKLAGRPGIYAFTDDVPLAGMNYYRLRQIDFDGTFALTGVVAVRSFQSGATSSLFPNPAGDELTLRTANLPATVRVQCVNGPIFTLSVAAGGRVDVSRLVPGFYVLTSPVNGAFAALRFVKK